MPHAIVQTTPTANRIRLLQSMPIFGGLTEATLEYLLSLARVVEHKEGEYFYREGEPARSVFVLESGEVGMYKTWRNRDYRISTLHRGDSFGQVALIDLGPRNTSILALTNCCALELTSHDLHQLYQRDSNQYIMLYMNMARDICRRLRASDQRAFEANMTCKNDI